MRKLTSYISFNEFKRSLNSNIDEIVLNKESVIEMFNKLSDGVLYVDNEDYESRKEEKDCYRFYRTHLNDPKYVNHPAYLQGRIFYNKFVEFIKDNFLGLKFVDLTEFSNLTLDELLVKTISIFEFNNNVVVFHPLFLYNEQAYACPDALIKYDGDYYLVNASAMTETKKIHMLEYLYNYNIINTILEYYGLGRVEDNVLCLIKYSRDNKGLFEITSTNYSSVFTLLRNDYQTVIFNEDENRKYEQDYINSLRENKKLCKDNRHLTFGNIVRGLKDDTYLDWKIKEDVKNNFINNVASIIDLAKFNNIINEAYSHLRKNSKIDDHLSLGLSAVGKPILTKDSSYKFLPTLNYASWWEYNDYFPYVKKLYILLGGKSTIYNYSYKLLTFNEKMNYVLAKNEQSIVDYLSEINKQRKTKKSIHSSASRLEKYLSSVNNTYPWIANKNFVSFATNLDRDLNYLKFNSIKSITSVFNGSLPLDNIVIQMCVHNKESFHTITLDPLKIEDPTLYYLNMLQYLYDIINGNKSLLVVYDKKNVIECLKQIYSYVYDQFELPALEAIYNALIDLEDFFNIDSEYAIVIPDLKGFSSLNKIISTIKMYDPKIFEEFECNFFSDTNEDIENIFIDRYFKVYDDINWEEKTNDITYLNTSYIDNLQAIVTFIKKLSKTTN